MELPPAPAEDREALAAWVWRHLGDLAADRSASGWFWGGQRAADAALAGFDVTGYAARRNQVLPAPARGASRLSPYIRHGLLALTRVWDHVEGGPGRDVAKFRQELLWQEYARHWYARLGPATGRPIRYQYVADTPGASPAAASEDDGFVAGAAGSGSAQPGASAGGDPWPAAMACVAVNTAELWADGWVVNQARMWLASQWTVRHGAPWDEGENLFFRHLLDGSRAANRLGWQWVGGLSRQDVYGFSQRQVLRRAPELCRSCELRDDCPIREWPRPAERRRLEPPPSLRRSEDNREAGPESVEAGAEPDWVWLTAESLGDADPALVHNPALPAVFVFDEPLLRRLQLSGKRLVFLAETLAELGSRRPLELHRGSPAEVLAGRRLAVTFAPVPGFRRLAARLAPAELHPWPWLRRPAGHSLASFSQWNRAHG